MALTITTSCLSLNARAICWSNSKSTSICASISTTKVAALNCCGFCTCRLQNSIMWTMRGNTTQAKDFIQRRRIRAVAEDTQLISEEAQEQQPATAVVSQSDKLTMFFKAEGTLADTLVMKVTRALEPIEGVSNVKVDILEGIATVELIKQTTVQATGVASGLVEVLQGLDFKLQSLNLSFEDEEDEEGLF